MRVDKGRELLFARPRPIAAQAIADLWQSLGLGASQDGSELVDPSGRNPEIAIVSKTFPDQPVEHRIVKAIPPGVAVGRRGQQIGLVAKAVRGRHLDCRLLIVRALDAACREAE